MKGSKTMSDFHKTDKTQSEKPNINTERGGVKPEDITSNHVKEISPAVIEKEVSKPQAQPSRTTNQSALRKSSNYSGRASQKTNIGSTASRTGKNIVGAALKSKHSSVVSSNRMIRTGAFQRIKA